MSTLARPTSFSAPPSPFPARSFSSSSSSSLSSSFGSSTTDCLLVGVTDVPR